MQWATLGSGSKGNAILVKSDKRRVLIDCGFSPRELRRRLEAIGESLAALDALLITHAHSDHVKGAARLSGPFRLLTYATRGTIEASSRRSGLSNPVPIEPDAPFEIGDLEVTAFRTPHDVPGSVGYVISDGTARLGICTDLGRPTERVAQALSGLDHLMLEFNHDERMLKEGPYPERLKRRIAAGTGHLSNRQAAALLAAIKDKPKGLTLAHLSEVNNTEALAIEAVREVASMPVDVAPQHAPMALRRVGSVSQGPAKRTARPDVRQVQLGKTVAAAPQSVAVTRQLSLFSSQSRSR